MCARSRSGPGPSLSSAASSASVSLAAPSVLAFVALPMAAFCRTEHLSPGGISTQYAHKKGVQPTQQRRVIVRYDTSSIMAPDILGLPRLTK